MSAQILQILNLRKQEKAHQTSVHIELSSGIHWPLSSQRELGLPQRKIWRKPGCPSRTNPVCPWDKPKVVPSATAQKIHVYVPCPCLTDRQHGNKKTNPNFGHGNGNVKMFAQGYSEIAKHRVRKPRVFINCHPDPLPKPPILPPKLAPANLSVVLCTPIHSNTRSGGSLGILKGVFGGVGRGGGDL